MTGHRVEAVLAEDGKLSLENLPFQAGQAVEIFVLPVNRTTVPPDTLRGSVLQYDRPTDPVAEADWSALQ
jgi:hypothetical protein